VLHPRFWGLGRRIYDEIVRRAFSELGLESVTVLLPPGRGSGAARAMLRLGFTPDGELDLAGHRFLRYRLRSSRP
jgi:RimJ/RimL family protein N-acetyltransferase